MGARRVTWGTFCSQARPRWPPTERLSVRRGRGAARPVVQRRSRPWSRSSCGSWPWSFAQDRENALPVTWCENPLFPIGAWTMAAEGVHGAGGGGGGLKFGGKKKKKKKKKK